MVWVALDGVSFVVYAVVFGLVWVVLVPPVLDCLDLVWCEVFSFEVGHFVVPGGVDVPLGDDAG